MADSEDKNALVYLLAGFGLGALLGAAAGLLFAPKAGNELRHDIGGKVKEIKGRTEEWIAEQKAKRAALAASDEIGA
jgi:gas vesicle protein